MGELCLRFDVVRAIGKKNKKIEGLMGFWALEEVFWSEKWREQDEEGIHNNEKSNK